MFNSAGIHVRGNQVYILARCRGPFHDVLIFRCRRGQGILYTMLL